MSSGPHHPIAQVSLRRQSTILPGPLPEEFAYLESPLPLQLYRIAFRHPSYPDSSNVLFTLHTWDRSGGGIHFGLAHTACSIVADNRFDGYLSVARDGSSRLELTWQSILPHVTTGYYFHVPASTCSPDHHPPSVPPYQWPFVPSFRDWKFPHSLPDIWQKCAKAQVESEHTAQSNQSAAVQNRDFTCKISLHSSSTEVAHIIPTHESQWFQRNGMSIYNNNTTLDAVNLLRDPNNALLLRSDIHKAFDDRKFCLFPKDENGFAVHVLQSAPDLRILYHNTRVEVPQCEAHYIFARFAWSIFPSLAGFLASTQRARLTVTWDESSEEWIEGESSTPLLMTRSVASRKSSPSKRSRIPSVGEGFNDKSADEIRGRKRHCVADAGPSRFSSGDLAGNAGGLTDGDSEVSPVPRDDVPIDVLSLDQLRQEALARQRPLGYRMPPYDKHRDAREELEIMGVEIISDGDNEGENDGYDD